MITTVTLNASIDKAYHMAEKIEMVLLCVSPKQITVLEEKD